MVWYPQLSQGSYKNQEDLGGAQNHEKIHNDVLFKIG